MNNGTKSNFKTFLTAVAFWNIAIISALAQFPEGGGPPGGGPMPPPPDRQEAPQVSNPKQFLNRLSKTLKLSDDQKAQIKPILDSEGHQLDELRKSTDSPEEAT